MRTYASSRVKRKSFYRKSELQMFLLICGGRIGGQFLSTNMAPPKLYKGSWNISANNSETVATKAWDLDKLFVYYSFITFHFVGFFYWTVSNAINTAQKKYDARLRDSENKECVPVFCKKKKRYRITVCFVLILHFFSPQNRTWKTTTTTTTQLTTTTGRSG